MKQRILPLAISAVLATAGTTANALSLDLSNQDFGQWIESIAKLYPTKLFGIAGTLNYSSAVATPSDLSNGCSFIKLAPGLQCNVVSQDPALGANIDQMVLYPNDVSPSHIIACNEQDADHVALQRISLQDTTAADGVTTIPAGTPENIVSSGLTSCDPVRMTPWGTVIFGEEAGTNGRMFEILNPLTTSGITVSGAGDETTTSDNTQVRFLPALGQLSFEGLAILPNGVTYYQDENRPGKGNGGGGYFKFVPKALWKSGAAFASLDDSPLVKGGRIFALRLGKNNGNTDFGSGNNAGRGVWVEVTDGKFGAPTTTAGVDRNNLRAATATLKGTTGYRPEDLDIDPNARSLGKVRICGTNTGQDAVGVNGDKNFGNVFCITDGAIATSGIVKTTVQTVDGIDYSINNGGSASIPEYQTLVENYLDFDMPDNIAFQPGRNNIILHEDGEGPTYNPPRNNDIWDCLDDGKDKDQLADSCVKIATLNDLTAETTGGIFDFTGQSYYLSIQHNISGHGVIVKLTGWQ